MRDASSRLLARIMLVLGAAPIATVAACGGQAELPPAGTGGSSDGGAQQDSATDAPQLPALPVPDGGYPSCVGETTAYTGPCCSDVYCYTPEAGNCPASADVTQADLGVYAPGSGTCECGRDGPFSPTGADAYTDKLGACCYVVGTQSCMGRPLVIDGEVRTADIQVGPGWDLREGAELGDVVGLLGSLDVSALDASLRARLAELWVEDAKMEHASIASFNRFSLQLMGLGAPAALLAAAQQAGLDEVRHAQLCLTMAGAYAQRSLAPGALKLDGQLLPELRLADVAAAAVIEGCVNETVASLEAALALERAEPAAVRAVLATIADDEARHAELAWQFVQWAVAQGGEPVRRAVMSAFDRAFDAPRKADATTRPHDESLPKFGRWPDAERQKILVRALAEVVGPAVHALLGS